MSIQHKHATCSLINAAFHSTGTSTPRRSDTTKTLTGANESELQIDTPAAQDDDQGGSAPKEYSRRLVEYFVVVSSVPKQVAHRERVNSSDRNVGKDWGNSKHEGSGSPTPKLTNRKSLDADGANGQVPPPPSTPADSKITPQMAARVDKRRGHLKESFRPGESVLPALSLSVLAPDDDPNPDPSNNNAIHKTNSDKSVKQGGAKTIASKLPSMAEQKKKFSEQTKKIGRQASGLQHQLETKIKSMNIGRSFSGDLNKQPQHQNSSDDSSFSSFSIEENSPSDDPPPVAFQPSTSPTTQKSGLTPSPSHPTPQKREGGASENIRIDNSFFASPSRGYNNDIDDCVLEPVITAQYPPVDRPDQPLNPMLTHFCHPQGVENIVPVHEYKMPKVHHFVLTDSTGSKLYGTCLTVYEEFSVDSQQALDSDDISLASMREEDQERNYVECSINEPPIVRRHRRRSMNHKYYAPRVLCILSTWPYLSAFRTYLTQVSA